MKILKSLLDVFFPENYTCEICGKEVFNGEKFCAGCKPTIHFNDESTCPVCGRKTEEPVLCIECKARAPVYKRAVSPLVYSGGVKSLIGNFKNGKAYLKEYFADLLYEACKVFTDADAIVFVPMTSKAKRKRGYNQSYLLAKALSARLNIPLIKDAIVKVKNTPPQKSLTRDEREKNLSGCFRARRNKVLGKKLILVDDVLTTGATADAVSAVLKRKGAHTVYFATVASVEYQTLL